MSRIRNKQTNTVNQDDRFFVYFLVIVLTLTWELPPPLNYWLVIALGGINSCAKNMLIISAHFWRPRNPPKSHKFPTYLNAPRIPPARVYIAAFRRVY